MPGTEVRDVYGLRESVSNITGTAVLGIHQYYNGRQPKSLDVAFELFVPPKRWAPARHIMRGMHPHVYERLRAIEAKQGHGLDAPADLLFLATIVAAQRSRLIVQPCVIPPEGYTWVSNAAAREIHSTLEHAIRRIEGLDAHPRGFRRGWLYESKLARKFPQATTGGGPTRPLARSGALLRGEPDMLCAGPRGSPTEAAAPARACHPGVHPRMVIEVKNTQSLQAEHILQTALYMLLAGRFTKDTHNVPVSGVLVSSATGQAVLVIPRTDTALFEIFQMLVDAKSGGEQSRTLNTYSDEEFLREAANDFAGLVQPCALPAWVAAQPAESKWAIWKEKA